MTMLAIKNIFGSGIMSPIVIPFYPPQNRMWEISKQEGYPFTCYMKQDLWARWGTCSTFSVTEEDKTLVFGCCGYRLSHYVGYIEKLVDFTKDQFFIEWTPRSSSSSFGVFSTKMTTPDGTSLSQPHRLSTDHSYNGSILVYPGTHYFSRVWCERVDTTWTIYSNTRKVAYDTEEGSVSVALNSTAGLTTEQISNVRCGMAFYDNYDSSPPNLQIFNAFIDRKR